MCVPFMSRVCPAPRETGIEPARLPWYGWPHPCAVRGLRARTRSGGKPCAQSLGRPVNRSRELDSEVEKTAVLGPVGSAGSSPRSMRSRIHASLPISYSLTSQFLPTSTPPYIIGERTIADPVQPVRQRLADLPRSVLEAGAGPRASARRRRAARDLPPRPWEERLRDLAMRAVQCRPERPRVPSAAFAVPTAMCGLAVNAASPIRHAPPRGRALDRESKMTWMKGSASRSGSRRAREGGSSLPRATSSLERSWGTRPRGTEVVNRMSSSPVRRSSNSAPRSHVAVPQPVQGAAGAVRALDRRIG
jgi:hypothetical protein